MSDLAFRAHICSDVNRTLAILGDLEIFIKIGALRDTKMPKEKVAATFNSECVLEGGGDPEAQRGLEHLKLNDVFTEERHEIRIVYKLILQEVGTVQDE